MKIITEELSNAARKFWSFFERIEKELFMNLQNEDLISQIDKAVTGLGDFDWEYGPDKDRKCYFSLSPNLDSGRIPEILTIISSAPTLKNWKFICGKPKKTELIEAFEVMDEKGDFQSVVTKHWYMRARKYKDGTFDIDVKTDMTVDEEEQHLLLKIHLTNLLGEMRFMEHIVNIRIVERFDDDDSQAGLPINDLDGIIPG